VKRRYPHSRFVGFAVLLALVMSILLTRLAWIQVISQERWQREAKAQSSQRVEVRPRRGAILDRNLNPLAFSERRVRVGVTDPTAWLDDPRLATLSGWLDLDPRHLRRRLRERRGHVVLRREMVLSPALADSLRRHPTLTLDPYHVRTYPMGNLGMRLLGHVAGHGHGDAGIEQLCDDILAGTSGLVLERFAGGAHRDRIMRIPQVAPVAGSDVVLALDYRVQMILEEELERARQEAGAREALAIVLEPNTGDVVALAEVPLLEDEDRTTAPPDAWRCRAISDLFEPGSTFKLFTVASLLSHGVCDTATVFDGEGKPGQHRSAARVRSATIHDVHPVGRVRSEDGLWLAGRDARTAASSVDLVAAHATHVGHRPGNRRQPDPDGRRLRGAHHRRYAANPPPGSVLVRRAGAPEPFAFQHRAPRDLHVAGKTGTGQISTKDGYLEDEFTASFVGFVPADRPNLLAVIVLCGAKGRMRWGGEAPARCFARTMRQVLVSTDWLDAGAVVVDEPRTELELPDLRGQQTAGVMALAETGRWVPVPDAPSAQAKVIGQMPPPGTLVSEGTRVQLAWAGGRP